MITFWSAFGPQSRPSAVGVNVLSEIHIRVILQRILRTSYEHGSPHGIIGLGCFVGSSLCPQPASPGDPCQLALGTELLLDHVELLHTDHRSLMFAVAFPLITGVGHWNKIRSIKSMGTGMVSAGFVVDREAWKENGTDTKLTHTQTHAHTCPDRHMLWAYTDTPRQTHMGLCSDTDCCLQMPVDTL